MNLKMHTTVYIYIYHQTLVVHLYYASCSLSRKRTNYNQTLIYKSWFIFKMRRYTHYIYNVQMNIYVLRKLIYEYKIMYNVLKDAYNVQYTL